MIREQLKEFVKRMTETSGLSEEQLAEKLNDAFDNKSNPSLPSNLDEAARYYLLNEHCSLLNEVMHQADIKAEMTYHKDIESAFKAGVKWYDSQMKMSNSSELISAWRGVKSILQEKDFRGDEWRLAFNAFMFGFSKGLNTRTKKK